MAAYYNEIDPFAAAWLRELIKAGHIAPGEVDTRSITDVEPSDLAGFTQCHFFAGIGVWSYALRQAGWPDDRQVWTGSCPCQPFSSAGKGAGFADKRHLWPYFHWLISQCRPAVVFGEQVASKDGLAWLDLVQADLEGTQYTFGALDTCAAGVGAPHIRQRLYWVGADTLGNASLWGCVRGEVGNEAGPQCPAFESRQTEGCWGHDVADDGACVRLAHSIGSGQQRQSWCSSAQKQRVAECGLSCCVAYAQGTECERPGETWSRWRGFADDMPDCRLDNAKCNGWRTRRNNDRGHDGQQFDAASENYRPGPTNGFWRDADWLLCRDGKWRPTQSIVVEMADGLADRLGYSRIGDRWSLNPLIQKAENRVGRLKGYGNAINAEQAKAFIEAFMEVSA